MADHHGQGQVDRLCLSRRALLARGVQAGAAFAGLGALATGCGSSSTGGSSAPSAASGPPSGTVTFMNYPGYMPQSMVAAFNKKYSKVKITQVAGDLNGDVQAAGQVIQNHGSYDMAYLTAASVEQALQAGVIGKPDFSKMPNIRNVDPKFRSSYPWGFPTDYGKNSFAYRKDLISERPTTWQEFWQIIPKYSGKVVFYQYDRVVIGSSLLGLGHDPNTTDPVEIKAATKQVIAAKPHLLEFASTNVAKSLAQGSAVLILDYDADAAAYIEKNPNIVWVNPSDGLTSYLEGWVAIKGTSELPAVETMMNFFMQPKPYSLYANLLPTYGTIAGVKPYLLPSIRTNPALVPPPSGVKLYFETYLGAEATKRWNDAWQQIQAA
ncbi:MAG: ABC transporter substrate-binding protein [Solirubrobacteraceae bacterium]